jgi:hypothetical protein
MLPQLEHSLRRLYASVNEMSERVQTAESAEFYTTFNEVCSVTDLRFCILPLSATNPKYDLWYKCVGHSKKKCNLHSEESHLNQLTLSKN